MRIYKLAHLAQALTDALGSGKFEDITYKDVWDRIDDETIFSFLKDRLHIGLLLSTIRPADRLELMLEWDNFHVQLLRFNGHGNGLCLLIGYLLEGIILRIQNLDYRLTLEMYGGAVPGDVMNSGPDDSFIH